jgi:hypothetical protein
MENIGLANSFVIKCCSILVKGGSPHVPLTDSPSKSGTKGKIPRAPSSCTVSLPSSNSPSTLRCTTSWSRSGAFACTGKSIPYCNITMKSSYASLLLAGASVAVAAPLPESATAQGLDIPFELQNILQNTDGSSAYTYPTSLTRGIVPVCLC